MSNSLPLNPFLSVRPRLSLTAETARQSLSYCPDTGVFIRLQSGRTRHCNVGLPAGSVTSTGYATISVAGHSYKAHRLAWLIFHGEWPAGQIDHINGIRTDNRIANLRVVNNRENGENKRKATASSTSGFLGVSWHKARCKWRAEIKHKGQKYHLGLFETPEEAYSTYIQKKRELHAACTI